MSCGNHALAIKAYLDESQPDMLALLEQLVCLESPTDVAASQLPVLNALQDFLSTLDYHCIRTPARQFGGNLYARPKTLALHKPRSRQLLIGHCDTVWPIGTLQVMPYRLQDGVVHGPGVYDMKAGLVAMLFALKALHKLDIHLSVCPVVFINSDEELGSRESTRYIRALAQGADRAMVMEPSSEPGGRLKTTRKGIGRFTITVIGKAAHAGLDPTAGASAILELSHVIQTLFALNDSHRGASVNVGVIDGGVRANVIAPQSSAVVDVRVTNMQDANRIEQAIRNLVPQTPGVSLQIEGGIGRPPMAPTPANRQLWQMASSHARDLQLELQEAMAGGGSDGNTTSQYTATLDGLGATGDGAHARHEHIRVEELTTRAALLAMLIMSPPLHSEPKR